MGQRVGIDWGNTLFIVALHLVVVVGLPVHLVRGGFATSEWALAAALWLITGLGITAGYHRYFSHRAFAAPFGVRLGLAISGAMALQNSILNWASDHRRHHSRPDTAADPYSIERGFWHAHIGWVFEDTGEPDFGNVKDLRADPLCRLQHRYYLALALCANLGVLALAGWLSDGWVGMLLVAGALRVVAVHHFTFFINSLAHMWGSRTWSLESSARDNWWLSFLTFGEGFHNYHHAFPWDYRNGRRWYAWDPTKWLIGGLAAVGLARRLRRASPDVVLAARYEVMAAAGRLPSIDDVFDRALDHLRGARQALARFRGPRTARRELKREVRRAYREARERLRALELAWSGVGYAH